MSCVTGLLVIVLSLACVQGVNGGKLPMNLPDPDDFFPADRTTVKWSHATNSIALLEQALSDPELLMLEADLQMGYLYGSDETVKIPVMAHGPEIHSDLSFEQFLADVMAFNNASTEQGHGMKGIKLDFKAVDAIEPVLQILVANNSAQFPFPVWLNADILKGPIDAASEPVNGTIFLNLIMDYLPQATMSTGWKTRYGEGSPTEGSYELEHMDEMIEFIRAHKVPSTTPITYPIRAGLGTQSISQIVYLLDNSELYWDDSAITLWHGGDDPPLDMDQLHLLVETVGRHRCFADIGIAL